MRSQADLAGSEVVAVVKRLAKQQKSPALAQLASRIMGMMRHRSGGDVFGKVKDLIQAMVGKLEKEADADAEEIRKEDTAEHVRLTGREIHTQCALCLTKVRPASREEVGWTQAKCPYGGTTKALSQAIQQLHAARLERQDLERQLQFHAGYGLQAGLARLVSTPEPD